MDAILAQPYKILLPPPRINRRITMQNPRRSLVLSVLADKNTNTSSTDHESKHVYNDNWFDRLAINHLSQSLQASTGSFIIIYVIVPACIYIKTILPPSKFAREYFAVFTTIFFAWLVGPCEVRESEFDGRKEKNVVHVPKCRFLEETNCVGMCTNLCKMSSQAFIKETLGMPFNMVPNFDDMSCEMIFGVEPPPQSIDPAFTQPCYKQCK
ncbi:hypothetical protein BUALT_Bualt02G0212900 [Buddleja alternifolia]|uniref:Beta-carotene isomerase D27-like C-terminal domain-containing protein n=1 Tax=Buddleja alternifolia TaxID=168488 RepID=A0AAV6Y972_9LAMI|nr:hypothetical protein BUALT_Bualt02G0212900 [Buddleja alternifolia]